MGIGPDGSIQNRRLLSALDAGDNVTATQIQALDTGTRILYRQQRAWQKKREKLIMFAAREEYRAVGASASQAVEFEANFANNFFSGNYFARKWKNPKGDVVDRSTLTYDEFQNSVGSPLPSSFRSRTAGRWSVDELLEAGYEPQFGNTIDTQADGMIDTFRSIISASIIRELKRNNLISKLSPREMNKNIERFGIAQGDLGSQADLQLADDVLDRRELKFNPDKFKQGRLRLDNNHFVNTLIEKSGLPRDLAADLRTERYWAPGYIDDALRFLFDIEIESDTIRNLRKITQGLKFLKLAGSPYQFIDLAGHRGFRTHFSMTRANWYGVKGNATYPLFLGRGVAGFMNPGVTRRTIGHFTGEVPELIGRFGKEEVFVHELPGLNRFGRDVFNLKREGLTTDPSKIRALGQFARRQSEKAGIPSRFGSNLEAGVNVIDNIAQGFRQFGAHFQSAIFDNVGGMLQIRFLKNNFAILAEEALEKGYTKQQFMRELAREANWLVSAQRFYQSIINSVERESAITILLFSGEPESFLRNALKGYIGAARLRAGLNPGAQNDIWMRQAISGFLTTYFLANVLHYANTATCQGEGKFLPLDRALPFEANRYATLGFSYNNDFLSNDTCLRAPLGYLRQDNIGPNDTELRLIDPGSWLESRYSQTARILVNNSKGETFFGEPYKNFADRVYQNFLDFGTSVVFEQGVAAFTGRGEGSRLGVYSLLQGAVNLHSPNLAEGEDLIAREWAQAEGIEGIETVEDFDQVQKRNFTYNSPWFEVELDTAQREYTRGQSQQNKFEKYRVEGVFQLGQAYAIRDLLTGFKRGAEPGYFKTDYMLLDDFRGDLRTLNSYRITAQQQIYTTYATAQLESLERPEPKSDVDEIVYGWWDVIDGARGDEGVTFNYDTFSERRDVFFFADGNQELGDRRREVVGEYQSVGPEPLFVQQIERLQFADRQDIAEIGEQINRDLRAANYEQIVLAILDSAGDAGRAVVGAYTSNQEITDELVEALFNDKLIELGKGKAAQLNN